MKEYQQTLILIAPPFTVSKEFIEAITTDFNFSESDEFKETLLLQKK